MRSVPGPHACNRAGCATIIESQTGPGRTRVYCSETCRNAARKARWGTQPRNSGPAIRLPKNPGLADVLRMANLDARTGCMVWPRLSRDGYARHGTHSLVHRLVATLLHGDLGGQPVHHVCGNRACINPDHLRVVTHGENTVEMLERTWYRAHIRDLRAALAQWAPLHPLLDVAWPDVGPKPMD